MIGGSRSSHGEHHEHGEHDERLGLQHSGAVTIVLDVSRAFAKLVHDVIATKNSKEHGEILMGLQEVKDATFRNGEAARAAIVRVGEDVTTMSGQIGDGLAMIADLKAQLEAGLNDRAALAEATAKLAEIEAGMTEVQTGLDATTAGLEGLDPIPGSPAPPAPPVDPNAPPV